MLRGGTSAIRSGGAPSSASVASLIATRMRASASGAVSRVSDHHNQLVGTGRLVGQAAHRDTTLPHTAQARHRLLQFIREKVASGANHEILGAPIDVEFPVGQIPDIAGVEPAVLDQMAGLLVVAVVTGGR
jgi:hypothetical protein